MSEEKQRVEPVPEYSYWLHMMWMRGYGTMEEVDLATERGEYVPFKQYPVKLSEGGNDESKQIQSEMSNAV